MNPSVEILVVEDSRTQVELLRSLLEGCGYKVVVALNGKHALVAIRQHRPTLVITDIEMPVMNGYELCRAIKQDPLLAEIPVILLTSLSDPTDVIRGLEAMADYYLTKPFDKEFLLARVESILHQPHAVQADVVGQPIKVLVEEKTHTVAADRRQILNLLLSSYANAVQRNHELIKSQNELTWTNHELTEQTARLRQSEERYRAVVEQTNDGICLIDTQTKRIMESNPAFQRLIGYSALDLQAMTILELMAGGGEETDAWLAAVLSAQSPRLDARQYCRKDGSLVDVEASASVIAYGGRRLICSVVRDVSERQRVAAELQRATELAESASRAKSEFLAHMSHEIRTPLNGVIGTVELLLGTELNSQQRRFVEIAKSSGESLNVLISDILDLSKIEAGKLEIESLDFDLHAVIEDAIEMLAQKASRKGVEMASYVAPEVPALVCGAPDRLRQVLVNLANNAIKFTEKGAVTIRLTLEGATPEYVSVRFEITDTGIGIPADRIDRLFKSFSQVDASVTRAYGGTGLGLVISKRLVELMGGSIGVRSEAGRGSTFWFDVRLGRQQSNPIRQRRHFRQLDARGLRVLAVDDNETSREILLQQITSWGMDAVTASDGRQSLEILAEAAARKQPFNVAIIDQHMPGMDGIELGKAIMASPALRETTLIILLSMENGVDLTGLKALGFSGHMTKPVRQSQLFDTIVSAVAAADAARPATQSSAQAASADEPLPRAGIKRGARILLVEDNDINQFVAAQILERSGYKYDVAADGEQAVRAAMMGQYDLILMDCQMPIMNGYEASRAIRAHEATTPGTARIPILAVTANAVKGDREQCLAAGMDGYVTKPLNARKLVVEIERLLAPALTSNEQSLTQAPDNSNDEDESEFNPPVREGKSSTGSFDLISLCARCMNDRSVMDQILARFEDRVVDMLKTVEQISESGDGLQTAFAAHALRGAAASVSADALMRRAADLERWARANELQQVRDGLDGLRREVQRCVQQIPEARASIGHELRSAAQAGK